MRLKLFKMNNNLLFVSYNLLVLLATTYLCIKVGWYGLFLMIGLTEYKYVYLGSVKGMCLEDKISDFKDDNYEDTQYSSAI
jgi:hypothetical protein